jgi:hypothetical protein
MISGFVREFASLIGYSFTQNHKGIRAAPVAYHIAARSSGEATNCTNWHELTDSEFRAMAEWAVALGERIVVAAALASTIEPTQQLIHDVAQRAGRAFAVRSMLCDGAWAHFERGEHAAYLAAIAPYLRAAVVWQPPRRTASPVASVRNLVRRSVRSQPFVA